MRALGGVDFIKYNALLNTIQVELQGGNSSNTDPSASLILSGQNWTKAI